MSLRDAVGHVLGSGADQADVFRELRVPDEGLEHFAALEDYLEITVKVVGQQASL